MQWNLYIDFQSLLLHLDIWTNVDVNLNKRLVRKNGRWFQIFVSKYSCIHKNFNKGFNLKDKYNGKF